MRRLVAVLCFAFACSAQASTYSSEISDLWYAPGEDGWGVNIVLQNNVAFATIYVYDVNRNPVWFTAVLGFSGTGFALSGNLFADRGPWYGGPYNSATVVERTAGTASFTLTTLNNATLTYTIDGVTVTKAMQRFTFANENFSGSYLGGLSANRSGCTPSSLNGIVNSPIALTITQTGASILMVTTVEGGTCSFNGTYLQTGKLGAASGTFSCSYGSTGTFNMFEMTPTISGFTAKFSDGNPVGQNPGCQLAEGFIGGVRTLP